MHAVTVRFGDLLAAVQTVHPGNVIPYKARISLGLDVPNSASGPVSLPISKEGSLLAVPAPPRIDVRISSDVALVHECRGGSCSGSRISTSSGGG